MQYDMHHKLVQYVRGYCILQYTDMSGDRRLVNRRLVIGVIE